MNDNVQDLDYTVNRMFNSDGTRKATRDENAYNLSVNRPMVKNRRTKKKKAMGIKEIATKTIILVALSAGLTVGIHELHEAMEVGENAKEIKNELAALAPLLVPPLDAFIRIFCKAVTSLISILPSPLISARFSYASVQLLLFPEILNCKAVTSDTDTFPSPFKS